MKALIKVSKTIKCDQFFLCEIPYLLPSQQSSPSLVSNFLDKSLLFPPLPHKIQLPVWICQNKSCPLKERFSPPFVSLLPFVFTNGLQIYFRTVKVDHK